MTHRLKIVLLMGSILIGFLLSEGITRILFPSNPLSPLLAYCPHDRREFHVALNGVSPVVHYSTNRWGFRGDEPPSDWEGAWTFVTVGGSTTQCIFLDDQKTWPALLQKRLREKNPEAWIGNAGMHGHTTRAHLLFMREVVPKVKPDVLIFLVGVNDLLISLSEDLKGHEGRFRRDSWKYKLLSKSRLLQLLQVWKLSLTDPMTLRHGNFEPKPLTEKEARLPQDLREVLPLFDEYRGNLLSLIQLGKSMNVRMIFLTQPILFENTRYWQGIEGTFYRQKNREGKLSGATYWKFLDLYNRELLRICKREKVECFDLTSAIPHRHDYFYDTIHLNEKGADRVAQRISEYLLKQ